MNVPLVDNTLNENVIAVNVNVVNISSVDDVKGADHEGKSRPKRFLLRRRRRRREKDK